MPFHYLRLRILQLRGGGAQALWLEWARGLSTAAGPGATAWEVALGKLYIREVASWENALKKLALGKLEKREGTYLEQSYNLL